MKNIIWIGLAVLVLVMVVNIGDGGFEDISTEPQEGSFVYIVSSDSCPHCHALKEYLFSKETEVNIIETRSSRIPGAVLDKHGLKWQYGVPMMFAVSGDEIVAMSGFPTGSQNVDGYFLGKEEEMEICAESGEAHYDGGYVFCNMSSGLLLGNQYAADHIIDFCEKNDCDYFVNI